jgi:hypothetical protein
MIQLKGKTYDTLKFLAQVGLPAFGTFYFALAGIWGLPGAEQVVGTIVAVDTFLGVLLHISSSAYSKGIEQGGEVLINDDQISFQLDDTKTDIDKLGDKNEVRFKVVKPKAAAKKPRGGSK